MNMSAIEIHGLVDELNDWELRVAVECAVNNLVSGPPSNIDLVFKALVTVLNVEELSYLRDQLVLELSGALSDA